MPRYLEIDYIEEHLSKKRSLLNRCLLTVPQLDYSRDQETITKMDKIKAFVELHPDSKDVDDKCLADDFEILKEHSNDFMMLPERFHVKAARTTINLLEIIPSSNPDSPIPDSLDDLMLSDLEKEVEEYVVESISEISEDLAPLENNSTANPYLLEDVASINDNSESFAEPFSTVALSKKLRPAKLSDPFAKSYEEQLAVMRNDRHPFASFKEKDVEKRETEFTERNITEEKVEKIDLEKEDEMLLEDTLFMPEIDEKITEDFKIFDKIDKLKKMDIPLCDDKQYSVCKEQATIADVSIENLAMNDEKGKLSEQNRRQRELELLTDVKREIKKSEILEFESPVSASISIFKEEEMKPHDCVLKTIERHEISPLHESHFISPQSKMIYEVTNREKDKYLDDTLAMRLTVPELDDQQQNLLRMHALDVLNLEKQDTNCKLEVTLCWDPLQHSSHDIEYSKNMLSHELEFCARKEITSKDQIDDDLKKISIESINASELLKEDFQVRPERQTRDQNSEENKSFKLLESKKEAKKDFISKLEKLEAQKMKRYESQSSMEAVHEMHAPVASHVTLTPPKSAVKQPKSAWKPESNIESPLDHFVLLRTGERSEKIKPSNKLPVAMIPPRNIIKAAKVKPSVFKDDHKKEKQVQSIVESLIQKTPQKTSDKEEIQMTEKRREIISTELTDDYLNILKRLEKDSRPLLVFLKTKEVLSSEYQFFTLQPDVTRFLLKQQERKCESGALNDDDADIMKGVICLHALILSADAIKNYGIQAAIGVLKSIRETYENLIHGILEPVRKQLAKEHYKLETTSKMHPKLEKITSLIQSILLKPDRKIMVLVRRYFECCYSTMQASLRCMKNVVLKRYPKEAAEEGIVHNVISQANVIVAELSTELQFCPWNRFSVVFEFEFKEESEWYNVCFEENQNLHGFFAFDCLIAKHINEHDLNLQAIKTAKPSLDTENSLQCFSQHILIGSTTVTENKELLSELENRFNITLVERDYSLMYKNHQNANYYLQPDIIVDERTCIVLYTDDQHNERKLEDLIASVQFKCLKCYIIAWYFRALKTHLFPYKLAETLSKAILQSSKSKGGGDRVCFQVLHAFSVEQAAQHILEICNNARDASEVWTPEDWGKRFWLTEEMSMHEQFLLSFPYFTSFSAQIALTATSLKRLLSCTLPEMKLALKWIPEGTIEAFHASLNHDVFEEASSFCPISSIAKRSQDREKAETGINSYNGIYETSCQAPPLPPEDLTENMISDSHDDRLQGEGYSNNAQDYLPPQCVLRSSRKPCYPDAWHLPAYDTAMDKASYDGENMTNYQSDNRESLFYADDRNVKIEDECYMKKGFFDAQISSQSCGYPREADSRQKQYSQMAYQVDASFGCLDDKMSQPLYENEAWNINNKQRPATLNNSQQIVYSKNFPKWKLSTNNCTQGQQSYSNGRPRNELQTMRHKNDKISFAPIPRSLLQDINHTDKQTALTPSKRCTSINTPSTVRLAPSKRRRLTYERDPGAKNGQTRLAFL